MMPASGYRNTGKGRPCRAATTAAEQDGLGFRYAV